MKIIRKTVFMVGESGGHIVMLEFKMVNERGYGDMEYVLEGDKTEEQHLTVMTQFRFLIPDLQLSFCVIISTALYLQSVYVIKPLVFL